MESESPATNECAVCGASAKSTCSGCKNVYYCSQDHQKQNWKIHRENCTPYKVAVDSQPSNSKSGSFASGKESAKQHLIASRDLRAGVIVFEESAAFHSPVWFFPLVGARQLNFDNELDQLCVACGKVLKPQSLSGEQLAREINERNTRPSKDNHFCSNCTWPVCSKECENNKCHAENECKFFIEHKIKFPPTPSPSTQPASETTEESAAENARKVATVIRVKFTYAIAMIRGVGLKRRDPKLFSKLGSLLGEQDNSAFFDSELRTILIDSIFQLKVWKNQKENENMSIDELMSLPLKGEEDYVVVFQLIQSGQFMVSKVDHMWGDPQPKSATYVYPGKSSLVSHSCVPNCAWTIGPPPDYKIRIRTAVPIKKGERLTLSRVGIPRLHYDVTMNRQLALKKRGISCKCERCMDPTELGLFSSAVACPSCKKSNKFLPGKNLGYLIPENPLLAEPNEYIWKCNNCVNNCDYAMDGAQYQDNMNKAIDKIQEMNLDLRRDEKELGFLSGGEIYRYWDEMGNRSVSLGETLGLHPNHTLLHYLVKTSVLNQFNIKQVPSTGAEFIQRRKERLLYCLAIEDKISPGLSVERARISATLLKLLYSILISADWTQNMSSKEIRDSYDLFKQCSADAFRFYRHEFSLPGEPMNVEAEMIPKVVNLVDAMNPPWLEKALNEKIVINI